MEAGGFFVVSGHYGSNEEEESYPPGTLSDLTGVNILLMKTLRNLNHGIARPVAQKRAT